MCYKRGACTRGKSTEAVDECCFCGCFILFCYFCIFCVSVFIVLLVEVLLAEIPLNISGGKKYQVVALVDGPGKIFRKCDVLFAGIVGNLFSLEEQRVITIFRPLEAKDSIGGLIEEDGLAELHGIEIYLSDNAAKNNDIKNFARLGWIGQANASKIIDESPE